MGMIEKAALAMANSDAAVMDVPQLGSVDEFRFDADRESYMLLARAVIEALMEPNEAMRIAAITHRLARGPLYEEIWQAMLTAALNEGEGA